MISLSRSCDVILCDGSALFSNRTLRRNTRRLYATLNARIISIIEPPGSRFSTLRPFISADGLIRVDGRLTNAPLAFLEKHPILLAKSYHLLLLLVYEAHALALHGGPQLIWNVLSRHYWMLHSNSLIR